ncbi:hypothetical protein H4R33_000806 [Dimargaris cristalligena]|uniref:Eukaryotic translation initiation factor 3 subunit K n=1 Tax=Dimargaris cristalligena TaxID=215637 RepID=A0A4P9ZRY7_9FUNG|nr:hypothetical protein H4R33_000806 [Dimargaris cristalligena]RKP36294.1 armadillo-type protein [Dimargaris cristalligena]|eukprot:RKP36294.1 armadillo-type protein [Dimargaris cristalligena]
MDSTFAPTTRPEAINQLINSVERYNPDNTEVLEEYLTNQCQNDENDLAANLAILKLYQFNPHLLNMSALVKILVKALTKFYDADFNLCLYLLNESIAAEEPIVKLMELKQYLEEAQFGLFWSTLRQSDYADLTVEVNDFDSSIRRTIAHVISMAYQTIDRPLLEQYLDLQGADLVSLLDTLGWSSSSEQADGVVTIPLNEYNRVEPTVITENVQFAQLTKIIGHANTV